jgi:hypothetical protein
LGTTIEFYSADPQGFIPLFSSEDEQTFVDKLKTYPMADFSFHLLLPDDMNRLCQSLLRQHLPVPPVFRNLLVEQLWYDGTSESLTLVSDSFASVVAGLSDAEIEKVAIDWSTEFNYNEPLQKTPAYQALVQLRKVAQEALTQKNALILHLLS